MVSILDMTEKCAMRKFINLQRILCEANHRRYIYSALVQMLQTVTEATSLHRLNSNRCHLNTWNWLISMVTHLKLGLAE